MLGSAAETIFVDVLVTTENSCTATEYENLLLYSSPLRESEFLQQENIHIHEGRWVCYILTFVTVLKKP